MEKSLFRSRSIAAEVATGFWRNLVPGLCLQALVIALAGAYFLSLDVRVLLDRLAQAKAAGGFVASAATTVLCGALLPWLVLLRRGEITARRPLADLAYLVLYWGWVGVQQDLFYRFQAWLWGAEACLSVVVAKVAFDQFVFSPFWSLPLMRLVFRWRVAGYDLPTFRSAFTLRGFVREVAVLTTSCWVVWIPASAVIFSMPRPMQFPLFSMVLVFFSLLTVTVFGRAKSSARPA